MADKPCHKCQHKRLKYVGNFTIWTCDLKLIKVALKEWDWKAGVGLPEKCKSFLAETG